MTEVQDPRWVILKPSRLSLALTLAGAAIAAAVIYSIDFPSWSPSWARALILLALAAQIGWEVGAILLKYRRSIRAFYLIESNGDALVPRDGGKGLIIRFRDGKAEREGVVCANAFVTPWFTGIPYRLPDDSFWRKCYPRVIPLWKDSLDARQFREVRVRLKWT